MKKCPKCNQILPYASFSKHKNRKDGYACYCLKCNSELHKRWAKNRSPEQKHKANLQTYQWQKANKKFYYKEAYKNYYKSPKGQINRLKKQLKLAKKGSINIMLIKINYYKTIIAQISSLERRLKVAKKENTKNRILTEIEKLYESTIY